MGESGRAVIAIVSSIVGLSIVAVVLSTRANTASVIGSAGQALSSVLGAATSPVTGAGGYGGGYGAASNLAPYLGNSLGGGIFNGVGGIP